MSDERKKTLIEKIRLDHEALHRQPIAWAVVLIPCLIAAIFFKCTDYGDLNLFDAGAQLNFLSQAKFPLIIMGLGTVLLSIVVNVHRTIQTSRQIKVTEKKNEGDYFLNHYKMCLENTSHIGSEISLEVEDETENQKGAWTAQKKYQDIKITLEHKKLNALYTLFFPRNNLRDGVIDIQPKALHERIESLIIDKIKEGTKKDKHAKLIEKMNSIATESQYDELTMYSFDCVPYIQIKNSHTSEDRVKFTPLQLFEIDMKFIFSEIAILMSAHHISYTISRGDSIEKKMFLGTFLLNESEKNTISYGSVCHVIQQLLEHFVDLEIAMGGDFNEIRTRAYIHFLVSYLIGREYLTRYNENVLLNT